MFTPTGYEHSSLGMYTSCICDQCTNNNCDNCHCYKKIGYNNDNIEHAKELYDSYGMTAVVEKYGVESSIYTLYFENQKIYSSYNEINPNIINCVFGISSDHTINISFYYNHNEIGSINSGVECTSFRDLLNFQNDFMSKGFKDIVRVEKETKKELMNN